MSARAPFRNSTSYETYLAEHLSSDASAPSPVPAALFRAGAKAKARASASRAVCALGEAPI